jgi:uncharacterized membrane protein YdbT with pleckstrin-like domain
MAYVDRLLGPGERIVTRTRRHPVVLFGSALVTLVIVLAVIVLRVAAARAGPDAVPPEAGPWLTGIAIAVVALIVARFAWRFAGWRAEEYLVTDRRVIQTRGVLSKRTADSWLEKVNDVVLEQSLAGRLLDYGDLEIVTGSDIGVNRLRRLRDPLAFKAGLLEAKARGGAALREPGVR